MGLESATVMAAIGCLCMGIFNMLKASVATTPERTPGLKSRPAGLQIGVARLCWNDMGGVDKVLHSITTICSLMQGWHFLVLCKLGVYSISVKDPHHDSFRRM